MKIVIGTPRGDKKRAKYPDGKEKYAPSKQVTNESGEEVTMIKGKTKIPGVRKWKNINEF